VIAGGPDRSFGNAGAIWSAVPTPYTPQATFRESFPAFVGGTAIGVHRVADTLALAVEGWAQKERGGPWLTSALAVVPPPGGVPFEADPAGGTLCYPLGPPAVAAEPVASCDGAGGTMIVLVRAMATLAGVPRTTWEYALHSVGTAGPADAWPVKRAWLFDPTAIPPSGNARIVMAGSAVVIVSTEWAQLRVTVAPRAGQAQTVTLPLSKKSIPGLVRMTVASLRMWGSQLSVALSAVLKDRSRGEVSHGALVKLRLGSTISLDNGFGKGGVWCSPRLVDDRDFICGGETSRGVAGVAGRAAVAFAVAADGRGLDQSFGVEGVCEVDLGGVAGSPVATNDRNEWIYVFAQRLSDLRAVGCRIRVRTGLFPDDHGSVDPNFGAGGVATLRFDSAPATPAAIMHDDAGVAVAVTRSIRGSDCDRVPALVALAPADGRPDETFGAGGFALHGSVGLPAAFAADGSCLFSARAGGDTVRLLRTAADGGAAGTIEPQLGVGAAEVRSMRRLVDGSALISGGAATGGWIAMLAPDGALDPSFGNGGVAQPIADPDELLLVGVRSDEHIVVRCAHNGWPAVALLHPDGTLDTAFGSGGFVELSRGPLVRVFAQNDDTLLCGCALARTEPDLNMLNGTPNIQPAKLGVQRILADGSYDAAFGWGAPSVFPPPGRTLVLRGAGTGPDDGFDSATPVAMASFGGHHYLVATGLVGGRLVPDPQGGWKKKPVWPALVVTRWQADGSADPTFTPQIGGYAPDRLYWTAIGALRESSSSLLAYGYAARRATTPGIGDLLPTIRQPQPALFRIAHPGGLDFSFGIGGAATMTMQDFGPAAAVAGVQLADGKVRLAVVDTLLRTYGQWPDPTLMRISSSFGGLAQFQ